MASNAQSVPAGAAGDATLAKGAIGLAGQLFQSITHMAPAAGVIFSAQYMASKGGASHSLAWLLATIACALTAICLVDVVRKVRSAGGYFVIHSVALGHLVGFTTSWLWFLFEPLVPAALSMFFGKVLSDFIANELGGPLVPWWLIAILMVALLTYVSWVGIKQSARLTVILGAAEILIMLVFAVLWIAKSGSNQPVVSFTPAASHEGYGGVFFAMIFGILSFLGFEAGVPLAEESNNAKRSLVVSILASCFGIGLFYIVLGYASDAGWALVNNAAHPEHLINFNAWSQDQATYFATGIPNDNPDQAIPGFANASSPYFAMGGAAMGFFGKLLMLFVIANSSFACSIAGYNAVTRVFYSLGRARVFPAALARINPRTQTPEYAIFLEAGLAIVIALFMGFMFGPFDAYGLMGLLFTIALMVVYAMTNLSSFMLYSRKYKDEFNVLRHAVLPLVSTIILFFPLAASLAPQVIFGILFGDYTPNAYPFSLGLPIAVVWTVLGIGVYLYLKSSRPEALDRMANEMAQVELVGEEYDPRSRATLRAELLAPSLYQDFTEPESHRE